MPPFNKYLLRPLVLFPVNKPKWWAVFRAIIIAIPAMIIAYASYNYGTKEPEVHKKLTEFIGSNFIALPCIILSPFILSLLMDVYEWFAKYLKDRTVNYFPSIQLATAISSLNVIVGKKLDRFGGLCNKVDKGEIAKSDIFHTLTQPSDQIHEIVRQFYAAMKTLSEIDDLKVVLVECSKGKPLDYSSYMPLNERADDDILKSGKSFFHSVSQHRNVLCIPCINTYLKKSTQIKKRGRHKKKNIYFHLYDGASPTGSILGIPIYHKHLSQVVYVLTLKSSIPNAFTKKMESNYKTMWQLYIDRIVLEHSLKHIKAYAS